MRKQINQVEILQKQGARRAYSLRGIGIEDGSAVRGSVHGRVCELGVAHIAQYQEAKMLGLCVAETKKKGRR